ncbi:unnamed protein product [Gongylonema pulchrum]|uniref:Integrase_H2C2 domain-containing protein n=1 Tax=Gongylonema pulchrum TaxID=637853 RepID=A0A183DWY4_9BILA|nr:unnamed protein product [Gongylonema pulchrum]
MIDLDDYRTELLLGLQEIRSRALEHIKKEQERAKRYYDERNRVKAEQFRVGERVLVYMPSELTTTRHPKFVHKYVVPYRILRLTDNSAIVQLIGRREQAFKVQLDHLRKVPPEAP